MLASPLVITSIEILDSFRSSGVSAIKFHSYQQSINHSNFAPYITLARWAESLGMPVLIDASFGSLDMYRFDNLRLVSYIAAEVTNVPIIILHSGGARVIQALLLAESSSNIFLETSFTLPYFLGSSVEGDLAFAYKKLGTDRVVYASDHPYVNSTYSLQTALDFCETHGFSSEHQSHIFSHTFCAIIWTPSKS